MTNGNCVYHRALQGEVNVLKSSMEKGDNDLKETDDNQWDEINKVKACLRDCIKTKTLVAIAAIVAVIILTVFGAVWAEITATRDTAYRIEKQLISIAPEIKDMSEAIDDEF